MGCSRKKRKRTNKAGLRVKTKGRVKFRVVDHKGIGIKKEKGLGLRNDHVLLIKMSIKQTGN